VIEPRVRIQRDISGTSRSSAVPYRMCFLIGLGGLFSGVTGPLLSTFIPPIALGTFHPRLQYAFS
jgi:hypothetical protein